MKKIILGNKDINTKYIFRETCFGICYKDNKILLAVDSNYNEYTLIGGGLRIMNLILIL